MIINISISIVGIANIVLDVDVRNTLYNTAPGKDVILKREPHNIVDIHAVMVLLDGKKIGYVRANDVRVYGLDCLLENERGYSAKIIGKHPAYESLKAIMQVEDSKIRPHTDESSIYDHWFYSGIVVDKLVVPEWDSLLNVMDSMHTLLDQRTATVDNMKPLMEQYVLLAEFGFSRDFFEDRKSLYSKILNYDEDSVQTLSKDMENVSAYIHNCDVRVKAYSRILKTIKKEIKSNGCIELKRYTVGKISKELKLFPKGLYAVKKKLSVFPSRLYYDQIPRKQLVQFLSGIALESILGAAEKVVKPKKNKRGCPPKNKKKETAMYYRIHGRNRWCWIEYFKEQLIGKINDVAAAIIKAGMLTGKIDPVVPFPDLEETFGHIGNRNDFNKSIRTLTEENSPHVRNHIELIRAVESEIDNL